MTQPETRTSDSEKLAIAVEALEYMLDHHLGAHEGARCPCPASRSVAESALRLIREEDEQ